MGLKFDMFFLAIILRSNCSVNSWRPFHCDWIFRKDMKRYEKDMKRYGLIWLVLTGDT